MATKETKPETKKTEHKKAPEAKDPPLPQEQDNLPPLPYKTCSLRVSIHCEGCKRKVKKILTSIEGVYKVDIDVKEQKVTVIGIVKPEILTKKLLKAGKLAEILPEKPDPKESKPEKPNPKNEEKKKTQKKEEIKTQLSDDGDATSGDGNKTGCGEELETGKIGAGSDEVVKSQAGEETGKPGDPVKEVKTEDKEIVTGAAGDQSPAMEETGEAKKAEAGGDNGSGSGGKKKKNKGQKGNKAENSTDTPARTGSPPPNPDRPYDQMEGNQMMTNNIPPRHHMYAYPPSYYAPPPPQNPPVVYGVSYNITQPPASVYGASYYTSPYSYSYMHPGFLPSDQNPHPSRPSDSFELFSDENPNACSVM
ncbi:PREDICTED: heavy metal-associated isoprenylated plant protein 3-like [Tarenaya hassleriana]|uniref:heavy metal-associated isoprenylated plant protein 3-like n=1 Tax=Tarenaya hassleriana TaxID=28532 RepID=UPI00053C2B86|nr:PREDICTED: heavy metal-associated isoprenylated plant protein 3-like [Tarenaya hassleriana]